MMPDEASLGDETRWAQRHPRLAAAFVATAAGTTIALLVSALAAGSVAALLRSALSLGTDGHYNAFGLFLGLEKSFVLFTSLWAFALFGAYTRRRGKGPWRAVLVGVACVMLSLLPISLYDEFATCHRVAVCVRYVFGKIWSDIELFVLVCSFIAFLPQLAGAVGGFLIWRITRSP